MVFNFKMDLDGIFSGMDALLETETVKNLYNWDWLSRQPGISEHYLIKYMDHYNHSHVCRHQNVTTAVLQILRDRNTVDYTQLVRNHNLSSDVQNAILDKVDWELFQKHQSMSPETLQMHMNHLNPEIVTRYQCMSEDMLHEIIQPYLRDKQYSKLRECIANILEHQNISSAFMDHVIELNTKALDDMFSGIKPDLLAVTTLMSLAKNQHCSNEILLRYFVDVKDVVALLHVRTLDWDTLLKFAERHKCSEMLACVLQTHMLDLPKLRKIILLHENIMDDICITIAFEKQPLTSTTHAWLLGITPDRLLPTAYTKMFLRAMNNDPCVPELDAIDMRLVNWYWISCTVLSQTQKQNILASYSKELDWSEFLQYNHLTENEIVQHSEYGNIQYKEWWTLLRRRPELKRSHADRLRWWNYVPVQHINTGIMDSEFLEDVLKNTDWVHTLRHEQLPEWYLRELAVLGDHIDMFWWKVCVYQTLSESFIQDHLAKVDICMIIKYQNLSEQFLEQFKCFLEVLE
jgi:hypothetical protein